MGLDECMFLFCRRTGKIMTFRIKWVMTLRGSRGSFAQGCSHDRTLVCHPVWSGVLLRACASATPHSLKLFSHRIDRQQTFHSTVVYRPNTPCREEVHKFNRSELIWYNAEFIVQDVYGVVKMSGFCIYVSCGNNAKEL